MLLKIVIAISKKNVPTGPSKPKSQFLFHKKGLPQDFIGKTLTSSDLHSYSYFFHNWLANKKVRR